jgi:acetyl-CoA carboxylase biotin carboxylase subunit
MNQRKEPVLFDAILVANRGEIACRVMRTARRMGVGTIAVYSEADAGLPHMREADIAVPIGPPPVAESYLRAEAILQAAKLTGAQAVHPGYGFLSESASFAQAVIDAGLGWIGPSPDAIEAMGDKINARNLAARVGVSVSPGTSDQVEDVEDCVAQAERIGFPVMVKAAAGGGGIGMSVALDEGSLRAAYDTARARAERFFGSPRILLERYIANARHVEVQILGLSDGRVVALGDRDCSVQRRHQKVAEETPSPGVGPALRRRLLKDAVRLGEAIGYRNAGTVECLVDPKSQAYVFLEMNTRLQVEHAITEETTGIDIVEQQLRIACDEDVSFVPENVYPTGHALELRVYAEDPVRFLPSPGRIAEYCEPSGPGIRVDSGYAAGDEVTRHYDPLIAKLVVSGDDRLEVLDRARRAVANFVITGPKTNLETFRALLENESFVSGSYDTDLLSRPLLD